MTRSEMFDDRLLQAFIDGFYGYGNYAGDYWFIGMEEGGGHTFAEVAQRLVDWDGRGRYELEDIVAYHEAIGVTRFFGDQPKLQATWKKLIRVVLAAEGRNSQVEDVRTYQQQGLGQKKSNNCLLELMPLPAPSTGHFLYAQHSRLAALANRRVYMQQYAALRAAHIKQRIEQYQPKTVIFYSANQAYITWWDEIAGVPFSPATNGAFHIGSNGQTVFARILHPTGFGMSNAYCSAVGNALAAKVAENGRNLNATHLDP